MQQRKNCCEVVLPQRFGGRFMSWVADLFLKPPGLLFCCWVMAGSGVGLLEHASFGRESGLPPLWPKNEKQPIRNFTFYISVNDL